MANVRRRRVLGSALALLLASNCNSLWAASPSAEDALKLTPVQKDAEFDKPANNAGATIKAETLDGKIGWIVRDGAGTILRRFLDTNGDNVVDQWCYYAAGIEVYRDIDANHDGKADQYRWLNTGGTRWGIDTDQDGRIDQWKIISAEEVTAEVVRAIGDRDAARFNRLVITKGEIDALGVGEKQAEELASMIEDAPTKFRTYLTNEKSPGAKFASAGSKLKWLHFGGSLPGIVPTGSGGATKDIVAYENVLAMVESEGKHEQIPIGTLVKIDNVWRIIDAPRENDDQLASAGFFFKGTNTRDPDRGGFGTGGGNDKLQEIAKKLQDMSVKIAEAKPEDLPRLNKERADMLEQLAEGSKGEERETWYRQFADEVSVSAQSGNYPDGVARLKTLVTKLAGDAELEPYVMFRQMTAEYYTLIQQNNADPNHFAKVTSDWVANLKAFVTKFPKANDSAKAMLQLAINAEFSGQEDEAKQWYTQASQFDGDLPPARKAGGALTRLNSIGKPLNFNSNSIDQKAFSLAAYKGKVVVLHYWASWCQPFVNDMASLREIQAKYAKDVVLVGANLDEDKEAAATFMRQNRLPWVHLWEKGGLDSLLANQLGIVTVPTVILIDKQGRVVNRNAHVTELDKEIAPLVR